MSAPHIDRAADRPSGWAIGLLAFSIVAAMSAFGLLAVIGG